MFVILAHNWWTLLLRGILALVFGVLCFVYPGLTLIVLAMLFGAYALGWAKGNKDSKDVQLKETNSRGSDLVVDRV